ncbi:flagellar basal body-associated protein FliL [Shewanella corallii]|uniref:Flagellar protein FliL n=2 Tax=Shewanella TaxID=22 RepID=A0ABT0NCA7_9GAMM|nr:MULTISPECIES: flagellar basal body-associated protein FliL [Shewanella]MCL1039511.1 flagellar basal body-associated protein FliL [Shewanella submarina]MCL2916103.1 flagellar basal body-associated protein FliL [Shewanella corallii]
MTLLAGNARANEAQPQAEYAYYGFEPEIVTNYISNRKKLGFVRVSVELMVKSPDDLLMMEHHDPLLRSAIVEILGNQQEEQIKSMTGREDIRRECYDTVNQLLKQETGEARVVNLLFTRYLYD